MLACIVGSDVRCAVLRNVRGVVWCGVVWCAAFDGTSPLPTDLCGLLARDSSFFAGSGWLTTCLTQAVSVRFKPQGNGTHTKMVCHSCRWVPVPGATIPIATVVPVHELRPVRPSAKLSTRPRPRPSTGTGNLYAMLAPVPSEAALEAYAQHVRSAMQTLDRRQQQQQENARDEAFDQASHVLRQLLQPIDTGVKKFLATKELPGGGKGNVSVSKKPKIAATPLSQIEVRSVLRNARLPAAYTTMPLGHVSYVISHHD